MLDFLKSIFLVCLRSRTSLKLLITFCKVSNFLNTISVRGDICNSSYVKIHHMEKTKLSWEPVADLTLNELLIDPDYLPLLGRTG